MRRIDLFGIGILTAILIKIIFWGISGVFPNYSLTLNEVPVLKSIICFCAESTKYDITSICPKFGTTQTFGEVTMGFKLKDTNGIKEYCNKKKEKGWDVFYKDERIKLISEKDGIEQTLYKYGDEYVIATEIRGGVYERGYFMRCAREIEDFK